MPRFRLARRHDSPNWYVAWTEGGRSRRIPTGERERHKAQSFLTSFLAGRDAGPLILTGVETIAEILDGYLADRRGRVADHRRLCEVAKPLKRYLGALRPERLTIHHSRAYADQRDGCGPGTIAKELRTLRAALHWAVRANHIERAPALEIPTAPPPRDRWLSAAEAERLIAGAHAHHVRLFCLLALHTAARPSAALALTWPRVDLDRRLITLNPAGRIQTAKRRPVVPINDTLDAALREAAEIRTIDHVIEWGGQPVTSIKTGFRAARQRAGLGPEVTPYVLRHTSATWMALAGVPMRDIAAMLGHDDEATTSRIYAKHSPDYLRDAAAALQHHSDPVLETVPIDTKKAATPDERSPLSR